MKTRLLYQVSIFLASGILLLIESCTVYLPQPASIPLMNEKNEVQLNGGVSMLGGILGSVAFAPGNHVALQAYGSMHTSEISYFQGSVGYYTKSESNLNFEIYGGIGTGNGNNFNLDSEDYLNGSYLLYFAQANFGQTNLGSAHVDYGFGLKTGIFDVKVVDYVNSNPYSYRNNELLIEPQAFVRMGGEKFKVGFQVNGAGIINLGNETSAMIYYPANFSMSINYRFAPSIRRK